MSWAEEDGIEQEPPDHIKEAMHRFEKQYPKDRKPAPKPKALIPKGPNMPKTEELPEFKPGASVHTSESLSRTGQADDEFDEHFEEPFVEEVGDGPHSEVEVSIGETINLGNYNSARVHVNVRVPTNQGDEEAGIKYAEHVARDHLTRISKTYRK